MKHQSILSHTQRIQALLEGRSLDRTPVALWRHFPVDDQDPDTLASATVQFQDQFDFDLIKITPASSFQIKDWGVTDIWRGNPEGSREYTKRFIHDPDDWLKLKPVNINQGNLSKQLECVKLIVSRYKGSTPVLQTIFSPLAQAKNLAGNDVLLFHLRLYPDLVSKALDVITETTIEFIRALTRIGVDGFFYAVQHAQFSILTIDEFNKFGRRFDLPLLQEARPLWCNLLHIHGDHIQFSEVKDYPVQIFNWHDRTTPPSLADALSIVNGCVCGGLQQWHTLVYGEPKDVKSEALSAMEQCQGHRFLLGTGCVTPVIAPVGNIMAARHSVDHQL